MAKNSQILVDVFECDATVDHHDLQVVDELAHLLRGTIGAFVFSCDPGLARFFDDLLADEMRALAQFVNGLASRPAWKRPSRLIRQKGIQKSSLFLSILKKLMEGQALNAASAFSRMESMASAGFSAPYTAEPATNTSAPASATIWAVFGLTPPST